MVHSISVIIVHLLATLFYNIIKVLRYFSYKKATRKNNLLILQWKGVVEYKGKKIIKGNKFDEYISKMISDKGNFLIIKDFPKKIAGFNIFNMVYICSDY